MHLMQLKLEMHAYKLCDNEVFSAMQPSVQALLLASQFFGDPLVRLTCGISIIVMTLVSSTMNTLAGFVRETHTAARHNAHLLLLQSV